MQLNIEQIMEILPHRPPFLLVDKITDCEPGVKATGIKCVTMNEPFFVGHFPGKPITPALNSRFFPAMCWSSAANWWNSTAPSDSARR